MIKTSNRPKTILVHMNREPVDALGEIFMRLPFLRLLRDWAPEAHITIIPGLGGATFWEELLAPLVAPLVDEIRRDALPDPTKESFEWVFDMEGDAKTSWLMRRLAKKTFIPLLGADFSTFHTCLSIMANISHAATSACSSKQLGLPQHPSGHGRCRKHIAKLPSNCCQAVQPI